MTHAAAKTNTNRLWRLFLVILALLVSHLCYAIYSHAIKWGKVSHDSSNMVFMRDKLTYYHASNNEFPVKLRDAVGAQYAEEYQYVNCVTNCLLMSKSYPHVIAIIKPCVSDCIIMYNCNGDEWLLLK